MIHTAPSEETAVDIDIKNFNTGYNIDSIFITCGCCGQEIGGNQISAVELDVESKELIKKCYEKWLNILSLNVTENNFSDLLKENLKDGFITDCDDCCLYVQLNFLL